MLYGKSIFQFGIGQILQIGMLLIGCYYLNYQNNSM